ncbi:type IX secretion system outer membrane channel protein PorV [uncultured Dokdonia sp.]|uniref:type IX secretion system outer membrane channel protein PorV n=1 Tax=uncultured Dokdonia sp. TaxID=575653 RepID=UPI00262C8887|nr:type IX secretion system outer membrane channel protein PorV [uncultured Dokdonia sp.]
MKKMMMLCLGACFAFNATVQAQDEPNTITTAVPFLVIAADARAAGLGEQGVATSPDVYGVQWNPAKLAFLDTKHNIGVNYTPYLGNLVNDIAILQAAYANRIDEKSAFGASLRYFSLGTITTTTGPNDPGLDIRPNEFTIDATYALKLSERFSMAVSGRYLRSDLRIQQLDPDARAASSFGVDISGYYQSEEITYNSFDGRWRGGFNISNIGPEVSYSDADNDDDFIPTNLKLGGGFDFILDGYNRVFVGLEFNKLLVPTPPRRDGEGNIIAGQDDNVSFFQGIFQSFGDAPDGFSEELKEFTWSLGAEYVYDNAFSLRAGYFNESDIKGARKFATLGAGFEFNAIDIDLSYLFSTGSVRSPLENTLRFGLTFHFGDEFDEY